MSNWFDRIGSIHLPRRYLCPARQHYPLRSSDLRLLPQNEEGNATIRQSYRRHASLPSIPWRDDCQFPHRAEKLLVSLLPLFVRSDLSPLAAAKLSSAKDSMANSQQSKSTSLASMLYQWCLLSVLLRESTTTSLMFVG